MSHLTEDEQARVNRTLRWTSRMAAKYGGTCYEKNGKTWDWGQALCRECYGPDWMKEIERLEIETPTWENLGRAKRWEEGDLPEWFDKKESC